MRSFPSSRFWWLLLALAFCKRQSPSAPPAPSPAPTIASAEGQPSEPENIPAPPAQSPPLADAVRGRRFQKALAAIEAMPEVLRKAAGVRYTHARLLVQAGRPCEAMPLLTDLDTKLPALSTDIRVRANEATLLCSPTAEAEEFFLRDGTVRGALVVARALLRENPSRAAEAASRLLQMQKRTRAEEAEARAIRFRIEKRSADARYLFVEAPDLLHSKEVTKETVGDALTPKDWLTRAKHLSEAGRTDEALAAVEQSANGRGKDISGKERLRARADTLYRDRKRYLEASKAYEELWALGGDEAPECAFLSARALSRADRDDDAMKQYERVHRRFRKSPWGDRAKYFMAYLKMLHGKWAEARDGFKEYVSEYPQGVEERHARRLLALSFLLSGRASDARRAFEDLAAREGDPVSTGRMLNMAALSSLEDGDRLHALSRWTDVAKTRPLTYPAMVARARLAEHHAPIPPIVDGNAGDPPAPLAVSLPAPADTFHSLGFDDDAESALRQREDIVVRGAGARSTEALCLAYAALNTGRRRYELSQTLPAALFREGPGPTNAWAWDCAYPTPFRNAVLEAEHQEALPPGLVYAVMRQESGYQPEVVSPARAVGLLQLLPETARKVAADLGRPDEDLSLKDPETNITLGAHYLRELLNRFSSNIPLSVGAYNAGPEAVQRWLERSPDLALDVFVEKIPYEETRNYVVRVLGNLCRYGYKEFGERGVAMLDLKLPKRSAQKHAVPTQP